MSAAILKSFLEVIKIFFVFLPFGFETVHAVAVSPSLAVIVNVEALVHLGQRIHTEDFVDLSKCKKPQCKLEREENKKGKVLVKSH